MECFHCGQENSEDAVFCKYCGQQIEGKITCPVCEKPIDCDSQFCEFCGATIQTTYESDAINAKSRQSMASNPSTHIYKSQWKNATDVCLGIFSMLSVFLSLIFTFFIGIKFSGNYSADIGASFISNGKNNLFYYFGECYEDLAAIIKQFPDLDISNLYFIAVLGTILSIAIIVSAVTFAVISLIRYVNSINGKSKKSYFPSVLASNIAFILGATLFFAFNAATGKIETAEISTQLNSITIAGLVLSSIFTVLAVVCKTASLGKLLAEPINVNKICFSILGVIALAFVIAFTAVPSISIELENNYISFNFVKALHLFFMLDTVNTDGNMFAAVNVTPEMYAYTIIGLFIEIAVTVMAFVTIASLLNNMSRQDRPHNIIALGMSIAITVLSATLLILTIIFDKTLLDFIFSDNSESLSKARSYNPTSLIVAVVISAVNLVIQIIHSITNFKTKPNVP